MNLRFIVGKINRDIRIVQEIIHEILLDHVAFVAKANDKIIEAIMAINFHDMPENGLTADLHHGLGPGICFFRYPGAEASCKYHYFHQRLIWFRKV
jgi:hypothetical protein